MKQRVGNICREEEQPFFIVAFAVFDVNLVLLIPHLSECQICFLVWKAPCSNERCQHFIKMRVYLGKYFLNSVE